MKFVKRITALFLALTMVMAMGITAFADEATYTISAPSDDTHTYQVYQILKGTLSTDGTTLSNISAGKNFKGTDAAAAAEALGKVDNTSTDKMKLSTIEQYVDLTSAAFGTVSASSSLSAPAGYYLIKDTAGSLSGKDDAYTTYITTVVGNVTIERKATKPQVQKKVKDANDTTDTAQTVNGWQDSADHDVNDDVEFQLTATLPSDATDFAAYTSYKLVFHDKQSAGLTFKPDTVTVYYDTAAHTLTSSQYTLTQNPDDGDTFDITITDVKSLGFDVVAGGKFYVEYKSTLNENSVIGSAGNPNEVYLEYSNNPNTNGSGETGKTPKDKVIVFTYKVVVNKVDQENKANDKLADAKFTLYKGTYTETKQDDGTNYTWTAVKSDLQVVKQADGSYKSTFERVDDGVYKLEETKVPDGYNKAADVIFTISATHDTTSDNPTLVTLDGGDKFSGDVSTGALSTNIQNKPGTNLPSTGGMGTTVLYVAGIAMILAAGIVVIARKRNA